MLRPATPTLHRATAVTAATPLNTADAVAIRSTVKTTATRRGCAACGGMYGGDAAGGQRRRRGSVFLHVVEYLGHIVILLEFLQEFVDGGALLLGDRLEVVGDAHELG